MDDTKNRTSTAPSSSVSPQLSGTGAASGRQTLTKEQRDTIFAAAAANMQPARKKSTATLLTEWQSQVMEYYRNGFSPAQIRDLLRAGKVVTNLRAFLSPIGREDTCASARPTRRFRNPGRMISRGAAQEFAHGGAEK